MLPIDINKALDNLNTTFALPVPAPFNVAALNYTFTDIEIEDGYAAFAIRGSVDPIDTSEPRFDGTVTMPPVDALNAVSNDMTLEMTPLLFDSAGYTYDRANALSFTVGPKLIPATSPIQLTTDTFVSVAPGLSKWPEHNMNLTMSTRGGPTVKFSPMTKSGIVMHTNRI